MSNIEVNGVVLDTEYISKNKAQKVFHKSPETLQKLVDKYKHPNGPLRINQTEGGGIRFNVYDMQKLFDTNFEWRGDGDSPIDPYIVYEDLHNPDHVDPEDEDFVDCDTQINAVPTPGKKVRYVYKILKDEKTVETWLLEPTADQLRDNFSPGSYRIIKIDRSNGNMTVQSKMVKIDADPNNPSALDQHFNDLSKLQSMINAVGGNSNNKGHSEDYQLKMMEMNQKSNDRVQQFLTTLLLEQLGGKPGKGMDLIESIKLLATIKESGVFGSDSDDDSVSGVIKQAAEVILPLLGGNGTAQNQPLQQFVPIEPSKLERVDPVDRVLQQNGRKKPEVYYKKGPETTASSSAPVTPRVISLKGK